MDLAKVFKSRFCLLSPVLTPLSTVRHGSLFKAKTARFGRFCMYERKRSQLTSFGAVRGNRNPVLSLARIRSTTKP